MLNTASSQTMLTQDIVAQEHIRMDQLSCAAAVYYNNIMSLIKLR